MANYNSSELAARIAKKLNLSGDETDRLYDQLSQIGNGPVKDAFAALCGPQTAMKKYAGVIRAESTRDVQYEKTSNSDHLDDNAWVDIGKMPLFLGFVEAESPSRAKHIAAARTGVDTSVIEIYDVETSEIMV